MNVPHLMSTIKLITLVTKVYHYYKMCCFVYVGYYDDVSSYTKIGQTTDLYGRMCSYNTSHPTNDFIVYILIEVDQQSLDELELILHDHYDSLKARHSSQYNHRNPDNEWITIRPTRSDIVEILNEMELPFKYNILSDDEITNEVNKIKRREIIEINIKQVLRDRLLKKIRDMKRERKGEIHSWNERDYQRDIIDNSLEQLILCGRIYIELATGAGKTYIVYNIIRKLSPRVIVSFSSRVNINKQNINGKYTSILHRHYAIFDCSTDNNYTSFARENEYHIIVACTQSHEKVYKMLCDTEISDICIWFDEAHYGVEKWVDDTIIDPNSSPRANESKTFLIRDDRIRNRIFTSASPDVKHVELHRDVFGELHKGIKVNQLMKLGWLCGITPYIFGTDTSTGDINQYNLNHFTKYGAAFGFSFHSSRHNAFTLFEQHCKSYNDGDTSIKPFLLVGNDYKNDDFRKISLPYEYRCLDTFMNKDSPNSIAYICDMYKMGFDFRELDYLIFSDPKFSWQDIIQCIGRGTRSDMKGVNGTNRFKTLKVLLPVFVDGTDEKYNNIVNVLQYLIYDVDIMPASIEMDFRSFDKTGNGAAIPRDSGTYDGDETPNAVILDLVTRRKMVWKYDEFVKLLREHEIHTREDYNSFHDEYSHMSLPEHPGRVEFPDFSWEETYEISPYYPEEECRKKIMDIVNDDDDIELDDMENPAEYLHKQDNKIPPIDYKGFYGIDPPF